MELSIIRADYNNPQHQQQITDLLDNYARDPMGGGEALAPEIKAGLVDNLIKFGKAFSVLAYVGEQPVGLTNCMFGFSSFAAKELVNIHDIYVEPDYRGQGISHKMMEKVERIARETGCCKITLEVLSNNHSAKTSYRKFGFSDYELDPTAGTALFWQKKLL